VELWNCGKEGEGKGSNKAEAMTDGKRPRLGQNKPLDRNRNYRIRHNRKEIGSERKKKKKKKTEIERKEEKNKKSILPLRFSLTLYLSFSSLLSRFSLHS
jgi:hypothetical protein